MLDSLGVSNITTDLAIIALAATLLWNVQMPLAKRFDIFSTFGARILSGTPDMLAIAKPYRVLGYALRQSSTSPS